MNKDVRNNNIIKYFQEGGQKRRKCPEGMRWSKKKNTCVDTIAKKVGIETKAEKAGAIGFAAGLIGAFTGAGGFKKKNKR